MAGEKHYFWMPNSAEDFLAAVAAVQCLEDEIRHRGMLTEVELYVPNPHCLKFAKCLEPFSIASTEKQLCGDFDLTVEFDTELAYKLGATTMKHISQMFGIMCGAEPKPLPDLSALPVPLELSTDFLLFPWHGVERLAEILQANLPEAVVIRVAEDTSWDTQLEETLNAKWVIGVRSEFTYVAASLQRKVIEIYPTDKHRSWLSKWSNKSYNMIYADPDKVDPTLIYSVIRQNKK